MNARYALGSTFAGASSRREVAFGSRIDGTRRTPILDTVSPAYDAAVFVEDHDRHHAVAHRGKTRIAEGRKRGPAPHHVGRQSLDRCLVSAFHHRRAHPGAPSAKRKRNVETMTRAEFRRPPIETIEIGMALRAGDGARHRPASGGKRALRHQIEKDLSRRRAG